MGSLWNRPVEILLVDDDALSLHLMERSLRESRISSRVSSVKDGQEAVDFLTRAGSYSAARRPSCS